MTRPLALVFCAAFVLSSQAASAKPKVALTQIEGDASGDLRDAVVEALEGGKELSLISGRQVNRAVDKLGDVSDLTEKDFKKLADELEADAIVLGKLDKLGSSKTLKFRLFVHKKMAKGFTVSFKDAKSEKFRSMLHDKMIDKLGAGGGSDGEEEKPAKKKKGSAEDEEDPLATKKDKKDKKAKKAKVDDEDDTKPKKAKADEDDAKPKKAKADEDDAQPKKAKADEDDAKPKKAKADEDDAQPVESSEDDAKPAKPAKKADSDDEPAPRKSKKKVAVSDDGDEVEAGVRTTVEAPHAANRIAVRLDVGVSVVQRTLKFNSRPFAAQPKGAALKPVPGVRLEAEIYPLAFSNPNSAGAGLGIGVDYDKTLTLKLGTNTEPGVPVPVNQSHYSFGVRYRLAFGKTATSPTLTLGAGYGKRQSLADRSKLTTDAAKLDIARDTPDTNYTVIDPGLTFRLPVTKMVALSLGGRGMVITDAGPIQSLNSYGRAKVLGIEAGAALDVILGNRFALRFAGEFVQIGYQFTGVGMLSNALDNDATQKDVGGLSDRAIGGTATLAVMY